MKQFYVDYNMDLTEQTIVFVHDNQVSQLITNIEHNELMQIVNWLNKVIGTTSSELDTNPEQDKNSVPVNKP